VRPSLRVLIAEGAFYVWTRREFNDILGIDADIASSYWNVKADGNVDPRHDIQGELEEQVHLRQKCLKIECSRYCRILRRIE
jgi:uncharacterized protein YyaL (SSP411 family)